MDPRRRRVIWSPEAQRDLGAAIQFIAAKSPQGARSVLDAVLGTAESLSTLSSRGRVVPELGGPGYREVFVFRYRLMYRTTNGVVEIVAFLHGAQDFRSLSGAG